MFGIAKDRRGARVLQQLRDLVVMQRGIERNYGATGGDDTEVSGHPSGVIVGHNGQARSAGKVLLVDPAANGLGHLPEFGVRATFKMIVALKFNGHIVRPALGALDKAVVERGHGSWGIYTKCGYCSSVFSRGRLTSFTTKATKGHQGRTRSNTRFLHGFFCFFSAVAMALRNCSTAVTLGAFSASLAV